MVTQAPKGALFTLPTAGSMMEHGKISVRMHFSGQMWPNVKKKQKIYGAFCKGLLYNALCMDMYKL